MRIQIVENITLTPHHHPYHPLCKMQSTGIWCGSNGELVQDRYSDLPAILSRAGSWIFGIPKFHLVLPFQAEQ